MAGNVNVVMCVLPNGVDCRAPIQAASATPGVARQHREDYIRLRGPSLELSFACGQLARQRQTLSEATAH